MNDHLHHNFTGTARGYTTTYGRRESTFPSRIATPDYLQEGFRVGGREVDLRSGFSEFLMALSGLEMLFRVPSAAESGPHGILGVWDSDSNPEFPKIRSRNA